MTSLRIQLSQPCAESWDAMSPTAGGRHCAACAKTVVDFSQKTDAEILLHLAQASRAGVCGRLRADQVGRALAGAAGAPPAVRWRAWLGALLAAISLVPPGAARAAGRARQPVALAAPDPTLAPVTAPLPAAEPLLPAGSYRVAGVVLDAQNHEPIPGATILLQGTSTGTRTDEDGKFVLPISTSHSKVTLVISFVGYKNHRQEVELQGTSEPLIIQLKVDKYVLGGLGFVSPPPTLWQRVVQLFA